MSAPDASSSAPVRVAVVGGAGFIGGELLRLLIGHPRVELVGATSSSQAGKRVDGVHPNLRERTDLTFVAPDELGPCDVIALATPHKATMQRLEEFESLAGTVIDLSADFRLDAETYERYYGLEHEASERLPEFVMGLPELARDTIRGASRISVPGCMATAAILAVHPMAADGLIEGEITVDARTGSSGSGVAAGPENTHSERSGAMRVFAPTSHRHEAEIAQATGHTVRMTATGVEAVRGVQVMCRARLAEGVDEKAVRASFRAHYADEPFVRVVAQRRGGYRYPEPKILSGSNFCDVGFAVREDPAAAEVVLIGALDNLVKGGGGAAVQAMNVRYGWPETLGLEFPGLHPN